ncbi:hypothetical protein HY994_01765 [Candidatus Micrarchaeota archaeon]|nr:hypothetical protein [Candidatus Micrarchaeota archaeon]
MGSYAFLAGIVLSIVLGFMTAQAWMVAVLAVLGLIVAVLNITDKEVHSYLLANVAIMVGAGAFSSMLTVLAAPLNLGGIATMLQGILGNLVFFVTPGAVLIALKEIYSLAKDQ